jgi:uncharacterized membrane protein YdjX (TVP38/TMEM64 family)
VQVFVSRRDRNSALRWVVALCLLLVVGYAAVERYAPFLTDPVALRAWVEGFGLWAPVVFVALQAVQVVVAPIPGQVTVLLGGFLFGAVAGTAYSLIGATIGSTAVFWLSRRYGRRYVERIVRPALLAQFDTVTRDNALPAIFLAFLIPGIPDDVLCFAAGLTDIDLWKLVAVSVVGRLPSFVLVSFIGVEFANANLRSALALTAAFVAAIVVTYHYRVAVMRRISRG